MSRTTTREPLTVVQPEPVPDVAPFKPFVKAVGRGETLRRDLSREEAAEAMRLILTGGATRAQIGGFLIGQRVKGETAAEVLGFVDAVRANDVQQIRPRVSGLLDLAVPYDGKARTAQLAPAVAFVLVAAGVPVVLHGDRDVPTKRGVGPGPVLEALGVPTHLPPPAVATAIETTGLGYLDAARFAPNWHALLHLRGQFGLRTALNTVEKLINPANAPYQVSGFFHTKYIKHMRGAMTGRWQSWIVQGEEGSIEMAAGRRSRVYAAHEDEDLIVRPGDVDLPQRERIEVPPEVAVHARLNAEVLSGVDGPATEQVALTAGVILHLLGLTGDVAGGLTRARRLLASGAAANSLSRAAG